MKKITIYFFLLPNVFVLFYLVYGCGCFLLPSFFSSHQSFQTLVWISFSFLSPSFCSKLVLFWIVLSYFHTRTPLNNQTQSSVNSEQTFKVLLVFTLSVHFLVPLWLRLGPRSSFISHHVNIYGSQTSTPLKLG